MKCITYKRSYTKERVDGLILERCSRILECDDSAVVVDQFKKLCGNVFYDSLFVLPEHELVHQQRYTIAAPVFMLEGYLKQDARNMLNMITDFTVKSGISVTTLTNILHECTFREIMEPLGIPYNEVYLACFRVYLMFSNIDTALRDKLLEFIRTPGVTQHDAWLKFEEEVYKPNGNYFH